ncbi:surface lipoprotein assembly modifier [Hoeflea sp. AS60]|uniref:surface lipoprotein assembly modifier n=1 Tax=Hoeflea sp. AS60 TaxID=3135780 RepID=UPI00317E6006
MTALLLLSPFNRHAEAETTFRSAEALVTQGNYGEAQTLLETTRFQGTEAIPAAYLLAVVYARTGHPEKAEKLLRDILSREPDIDAVRIELVKILATQGKRQGASYQLSRLTDTADLARDKDQLEQLARQIGTKEGFSLSGYVSLAPSTNVNDGTSQSIIMIGGLPFLIANGARQKSGLGLKAGAVAGYSHSLSENLSAYAALSGGISDYSNDQFDKQQAELRAGLRRDELSYSLQAEAIVDRQWLNRKANSLGIGGRLSGKWNFSQSWWLSGEIIHMHRRFDATGSAAARTTRASTSLRHAFSKRFAMSVTGSFETETITGRPWSSYASPSVTLGAEMPLVHGIWMNASVSVGKRKFKDLFPGLRILRQDTFWEVRGSFRKDNFEIAGLSPIIGVFRKSQNSNVVFYDYATTGMDITFTKAF